MLKASRVVLWLQVFAASALIVLLVAVAGAYAQHLALTQSAFARTLPWWGCRRIQHRFFHSLFSALERPLYLQEPFVDLLWQHCALVALSSSIAVVIGTAAGVFITRARGREFASVVQAIASIGQIFPPVAVLVGMLAIVVDMAFERLARRVAWRA